MNIRTLIALTILLTVSLECAADIIYLKSGRQIQVNNAIVVGDKVVFTLFNGRMSIALSAIAKIERTKGPADPLASIRDTIIKPNPQTFSSSRNARPINSRTRTGNRNRSKNNLGSFQFRKGANATSGTKRKTGTGYYLDNGKYRNADVKMYDSNRFRIVKDNDKLRNADVKMTNGDADDPSRYTPVKLEEPDSTIDRMRKERARSNR